MKKLIFALLAIIMLNSCTSIIGTNTGKRSRQLELGMTKQEAINIMGKDYYMESVSQIPEGKLEVLHFRSSPHPEYLLYFVNGYLSEFHRYIPPTPLQQIIKEESKE